jgi:hypothetical protein
MSSKHGSIAAAPLLGPNTGSSKAALDPMSPQNLAASAVRQQIQATADTKYDPDVPPPVEGFVDNVSVGTSLVLIALVLLYNQCITSS